MKTNLFTFILLLISVHVVVAQDIITKRSGEEIKAKVFEITPTSIKYKRYDNLGGPDYSILRSDIETIKYQNGAKEVYNEAAVTNGPAQENKLDGQQMYYKGQQDARVQYRGYKGAGTGTLVVSLLSPLVGLIPAVATSSTIPKEHNLEYHDADLMQDRNYRNGYTAEARRIKSRKVWKNWSIALGVNVFVVLLTAGG